MTALERAREEAAPLPCPFCGGTDIAQQTDQGTKWGFIQCMGCAANGPEVRTQYETDEKWRASAVEAWNSRALLSRDAEVARLREALGGARKSLDWAEGVCVKLAFHSDKDVQMFACNLQGEIRSRVEMIEADLDAESMRTFSTPLVSRDGDVARLREALGKARQEIVDLAGYVPDFDDLPNLLAAIDAALRDGEAKP